MADVAMIAPLSGSRKDWMQALGHERMFFNLHEAVKAYEARGAAA